MHVVCNHVNRVQVSGKKIKRGLASEALEPTQTNVAASKPAGTVTAPARSPDAADTLLMTESQVEQAYAGHSVTPQDSQQPNDSQQPSSSTPLQDAGCAEDVDENMEGIEGEHGEEEANTDDEMVEPVLCHELYEAMDDKHYEQSDQAGDAQQGGTVKTEAEDAGAQKDKQEQSKHEQSKEPKETTEIATAIPNDPGDQLVSPIDIDGTESDKEMNKKGNKQPAKEEDENSSKGTHKDHLCQLCVLLLLL